MKESMSVKAGKFGWSIFLGAAAGVQGIVSGIRWLVASFRGLRTPAA